jgi:hypothetical protein
MSSIVIEEAQIKSHKERVATANLAQNKSQVHRVMEKKIRKYFLICEACFWCASYCEKLYYDYENSTRSQNITTQYASCPACGTDRVVELFPISFGRCDKPSTGESFH